MQIAESLISMKKLLIPEDEVVFKIVDLYSEMNEKRTEFMRINLDDFFSDSYIANLRKSISPGITPSRASRGSSEGRRFIENKDEPFIPTLRGVPIVNCIPPNHHYARINTCPLAKKLGTTLDLILKFCPIGGPLFFPLITDCLNTMEAFLVSSSSRIILSEFAEKIIECFIALKTVFMRLHDTELKDTFFKTVSHRNSPRRGVLREEKLAYPTSAHGPGPAAANMRDGAGSVGRQPTVLSERAGLRGVTRLNLEVYFNKKQSVLFHQKEAFSLFLKCIAELQLRARNRSVVQPFMEIFVLDPSFDRLCVIFTKGIIQDQIQLVQSTHQMLQQSGLLDEDSSDFGQQFNPSSVPPFTTQEQKLFLYTKQVLDYYKHQLIFCKLVIFEYRVNDRSGGSASPDVKRGLKKKIPALLSKLVSLFDPSTGPLWELLSVQNDLLSKLAKNSRFQTIKDVPTLAFNLNLIFNLFSGVVDLLATAFSVKFAYSEFLGESLVSHYLRMCYFGFVKIYSYVSNEEIVRINQKVMEKMNEDQATAVAAARAGTSAGSAFSNGKGFSPGKQGLGPGQVADEDEEDHLGDIERDSISRDFFGKRKGYKERAAHDPNEADRLFGPFSKSAFPGKKGNRTNKSSNSFPIQLSKIYLRVVLNMALNKNETVKNVFYQYRIMEFLYKEVDLEFEVSQLKERFLKVRDQAKKDKSRETSPMKESARPSDQRGTGIGQIYNPSQHNHQPSSATNSIGIPKLAIPPLVIPRDSNVGAPKMKLNIPSLKSKELPSNESNSIPSPKPALGGTGFSLDFSKLAPRGQQLAPNPGLSLAVNNLGSNKTAPPAKSIPPISLGNVGPVANLPPMIPKLGASMGINLEKLRGTAHSQPEFVIAPNQEPQSAKEQDDSSDSSSIDIEYDPSLQTPQKLSQNQLTIIQESKDSTQRDLIYQPIKQAKEPGQQDDDVPPSESSSRHDRLGMQMNFGSQVDLSENQDAYVNIYSPQEEGTSSSPLIVAKALEKRPVPTLSGAPQFSLKLDLKNLPKRGEPIKNPVVDNIGDGDESLDAPPVIPSLQKTPMVGGIPKLNLPLARGAPPQVPKFLPTIPPVEPVPQEALRSIYDSDQTQSGLMKIGEIHEKLITGSGQLNSQVNSNYATAFKGQYHMGGSPAGVANLETSLNINNPKLQLLLDNSSLKMSMKDNLCRSKQVTGSLEEFLSEDMIYFYARKLRRLYDDDELHSLVISLMLALLITPNSGVLESLYTCQHPVLTGMFNYLHILHLHLNHKMNRHIVPLVLGKMSELRPYPAGQRLLKLLCVYLNDSGIYKGWKKLANGAYGTIYDCHTGVGYPGEVVVKVAAFKESIYDRCVLHDMFSEITCLEYFRLQPNITALYDYGIHKGQYYIVMKKYQTSVKNWRLAQTLPLETMLPLYLRIFLKVLAAVQCLHSNNITHYDLKCDNVLIDGPALITNLHNLEELPFEIALADFGECKIFLNEDEELDLQNRGTEYIKSPEMLGLTLNSRKDGENYDRRRRPGTTRASDNWSLGCLFFELLTGKFLFYDPDWMKFYVRVANKDQELLTATNKADLNQNALLIEFITSVLVRNPFHRPTVDHIMTKLKHLIPQLTTLSIAQLEDPSSVPPMVSRGREYPTSDHQSLSSKSLLIEANKHLQDLERKMAEGGPLPSIVPTKGPRDRYTPAFVQVLESVALCTRDFFTESQDKLMFKGYTHVFSVEGVLQPEQLKRYRFILMNPSVVQTSTDVIKLVPKIFDFIREVYIMNGKLLFVEDLSDHSQLYLNSVFLREAILYSLASLFKCSVYDMWMLINNQTLYFNIPTESIQKLSSAIFHSQKILSLCQLFPNFQCFCGCNTLVVTSEALSKRSSKHCKCARADKTNLVEHCPSDGCMEYARFLKNQYSVNFEELKWRYFKPSDFIIGPLYTGQVRNKFYIRHLLCSEGPVENSTSYVKKSCAESQFYQPEGEVYQLFCCKICHMWIYGIETRDNEGKIVIPFNNLITNSRKNGLLQFKTGSGNNVSIKAPVMRKITLNDIYN